MPRSVFSVDFTVLRVAPPATVGMAVRHAWLTDQIIDIHTASRGTFGARRVHAELTIGRGVAVGREAIANLMRRSVRVVQPSV